MKPKDGDSKFSRAAQGGSSSLKTAPGGWGVGGGVFLCGCWMNEDPQELVWMEPRSRLIHDNSQACIRRLEKVQVNDSILDCRIKVKGKHTF